MVRQPPTLTRLPRQPRAPSTGARGSLSTAERLQVIQLEQACLLSQRSLTWSEAFNRSGMFVAAVSGAIIAIALVAQSTSFSRGFLAFAVVLLAVILVVGVATFVRLVAANNEDLLWVQGLNRLRHACLELADDLRPYMVSAWHDDDGGVLASLGAASDTRPFVHHVFVTTPAVVAMIDAVLAAAVAGVAVALVDGPAELAAAVAAVSFVSAAGVMTHYQLQALTSGRSRAAAHFPTPLRQPT